MITIIPTSRHNVGKIKIDLLIDQPNEIHVKKKKKQK